MLLAVIIINECPVAKLVCVYCTHAAKGALMLAEGVSCLKRTVARILIIVVSLGFGIVK
jgi:hypothetical protein